MCPTNRSRSAPSRSTASAGFLALAACLAVVAVCMASCNKKSLQDNLQGQANEHLKTLLARPEGIKPLGIRQAKIISPSDDSFSMVDAATIQPFKAESDKVFEMSIPVWVRGTDTNGERKALQGRYYVRLTRNDQNAWAVSTGNFSNIGPLTSRQLFRGWIGSSFFFTVMMFIILIPCTFSGNKWITSLGLLAIFVVSFFASGYFAYKCFDSFLAAIGLMLAYAVVLTIITTPIFAWQARKW